MNRADWARRIGFSYRGLLLVLVLVAVPTGAWLLAREVTWGTEAQGPMMHKVKRDVFFHEISERGSVESASNVEIRCEVQARGRSGTTILWVIPEGTYVQPGDELVRLDSSALENELTQQQIVCNNSEAAEVKARKDYESALLAKEEYLQGQYQLDRNMIEREIFNAEEAKRQAEQTLAYSQALERKGYVTSRRVETDEIAVQKARLDVISAKLKLQVLDEYTKKKMLNQLDSAIATSKAHLASQEASHKLDVEQRDLIQSQIEKCTIRAPEPGQVVYANETNRHGGNEIIIEEGTLLREHQEIIRLPDPKRMQVKAKINEAKIALVRPGLPVSMRMDAFPDMVLSGTVEKVNEYPAATGWWAGDVKEYETFITILNPPSALRAGLTAEVRILVEQLDSAIQVPVQAVLEHGRDRYCVLPDGKGWAARRVKTGSTNDKFVVIEEGLRADEEVVLGAFAYRDTVGLAEQPEKAKTSGRPGAIAADTRSPATPVGKTAPAGKDALAARSGPVAKGGPAGKGGPPAQGGPLTQDGLPGKSDSAGKGGPADKKSGGSMFDRLDANRDGKLEAGEMSGPMQSRLAEADANKDGAVDRSEWAKLRPRLPGRPGGSPPGQGAAP